MGNICRSPMAEWIMKEKIKERYHEEIEVTSRATSYEEEGNDMYPQAKEKLREKKIPYGPHQAKRLEIGDYDTYDYFICMEKKNVKNAYSILKGDPENKIFRLLDFTPLKRDISDPWYTGDFELTYQDLELGINYLLKYLEKKGD